MQKTQFNMRSLLGVVWWLACLLASLRVSYFAVIAVGFPAGWLGWELLTRLGLGSDSSKRISASNFMLPCFIALVIVVLLIFGVGPGNSQTWVLFVGCVLWSLLSGVKLSESRNFVACATVAALFWMLCFQGISMNVCDVTAGRHGNLFLGYFLIRWEGPNTSLIESYMGKRPAQWRSISSTSFGATSETNRFFKHQLIHDTDLRATLAVLPTEEARADVVRCLATPDNYLRIHQGLVLTALNSLGYPNGCDAHSWWDDHKSFFRVERDPSAAVQSARGVRHNIELSCHHRQHLRSLSGKPRSIRLRMEGQLMLYLRLAEDQETGRGDEAFIIALNSALSKAGYQRFETGHKTWFDNPPRNEGLIAGWDSLP